MKVVELATVVAAPSAARILSDFGAEVIKVESPGGDMMRRTGDGLAFPMEDGNNPLFDLFNSGKKLLSIDLKAEGGMAVMDRLLEQADIFISNIRMPSLEKLGLGYEAVHEKFPDLIYAHFSGLGLKGKEAADPGFDVTAFWMKSGALLDGVPDGAFPFRPSYAFGDLASASQLISGMLMALYARDHGKGGSFVSTSLFSAGLWHNIIYILNSQEKYGRKYPLDRHNPWNPFSDYYMCGDGKWVGVICKKYETDLPAFAEIFDMPELLTEPELKELIPLQQSGRMGEISRRVAAKMLERSSEEWLEEFRRIDVPAAPLVHFEDASRDEQAWANEYFEEYDGWDGVTANIPVPPIKISGYEAKHFVKPGPVGRDSREVLAEFGYTAEEIEKMMEDGIVK